MPVAFARKQLAHAPAHLGVLRENDRVSAFVGRAEPLARLTSAFHALMMAPARRAMRWPGLVFVIGEAGIGKTALLNRFATDVAAQGTTVVWGTCWDGEQAPA